MCAQVADHSRCMDALEELHAKGIHHGILNKFNRYFNYARKRSGIHRLREPDIDDDDDDKWMARFRDTLRTSLSFEPVCIPIAGAPSQTKLLQRDSRSGRSWSRLVWSISVCSVRKYLIPAIYSLIPSRAARWAIAIKARLSVQTARTANLHHRDDFHRQF